MNLHGPAHVLIRGWVELGVGLSIVARSPLLRQAMLLPLRRHLDDSVFLYGVEVWDYLL